MALIDSGCEAPLHFYKEFGEGRENEERGLIEGMSIPLVVLAVLFVSYL